MDDTTTDQNPATPVLLSDVRETPLGKIATADLLNRLRPNGKTVPVAAFNSSI